MNRFQLAALGGTFDHFHKGHQTLLKHAFRVAHKVIVGITVDNFILEKEFSSLIQSYPQRCQAVLEFVNTLDRKNDLDIVPLDDIYGPTLTNRNIDCLVVSPLTKPGADLINQRRKELKQSKLSIKTCSLELSTDNKPISSTRIRAGEINRNGYVYLDLISKDIKLTEKQKIYLRSPFGKLLPKIDNLKEELADLKNRLISVGDTATRICIENNLNIYFGIFDNLEQRQPVKNPIPNLLPENKPVIKVLNPPGLITTNLVSGLKQALRDNLYVEINGEEDLAVIPLTLLLPLEDLIIYGQPHKGIVLVKITEEKKEWVKNLLK